jgi:hypothetical protein
MDYFSSSPLHDSHTELDNISVLIGQKYPGYIHLEEPSVRYAARAIDIVPHSHTFLELLIDFGASVKYFSQSNKIRVAIIQK